MQYPEMYWKRVVEYRQTGHTLKETNETFRVSIGVIQKWEKRLTETWEIKNKPAKHPIKKLDPEKLKAYIEQHPDAYLKEIRAAFGCSAPAVLNALRRQGFTRKKRQSASRSKTPKG